MVMLTLAAPAIAGSDHSASEPALAAAVQKESVAKAPVLEATKLVINIPSRTLWVYQGSKIVRYFPVGVGRPGFMTPVGDYSVLRKVVDPGWENPYKPAGEIRIVPGQNNPLGTRWIGFLRKGAGEYGMHGTDNPGSVGKFSSHGCVRLKVPDAEALFDMVEIGTPVAVVYEPVLIRPQGDEMRVVVFRDVFGRGMPTAEQVHARIMAEYPNARVDDTLLRKALQQPTERPIPVGALMPTETKATSVQGEALPGSVLLPEPERVSGTP